MTDSDLRARIEELETSLREAASLIRLGSEFMRQHLVIEEWCHFRDAAVRFREICDKRLLT